MRTCFGDYMGDTCQGHNNCPEGGPCFSHTSLTKGACDCPYPEDKVLHMFNEAVKEQDDLRGHSAEEWWSSRRMAIIDTLNALNVKIEGVNA